MTLGVFKAAAMETRYGVDLDGDVEMTTTQCTSSSRHQTCPASLIAWNREWQQYLTKIRHRCSVTGESFEGDVATVKGSVELAVLETLATYVLKTRVEKVQDTEFLTQVQKRCRSLKNVFIPDIGTLLWEALKMNMQKDDCDARIFQFPFTKIAPIGSGNATSPDNKDRMKARCEIRVENTQPVMLKEQAKRLIKYERSDCKMEDVALFDLMFEHARLQHRFHVQSVERAAPQVLGQLSQQKAKKQPKHEKPTAPAAAKKPRSPPRDGCLVWQGPHWLDECPTATAEQRAGPLTKVREANNTWESAKPVSVVVRTNMIPYIPDSGADRTMIPRVVVKSLQELGRSLDMQRLKRPDRCIWLTVGSHGVWNKSPWRWNLSQPRGLSASSVARSVNLFCRKCIVR
ncbi:hypothetical protein PHMEG_00020911 [Phytophthora megakarya]|uniref:Uncharacterized protein n=1 Tax=Phytophthora megakarya TaxID=4795 RepID=A0A225VQH2_9STRA|nr:hypothetical protein PHMEG_00020911 [Phytophthora megakarya]